MAGAPGSDRPNSNAPPWLKVRPSRNFMKTVPMIAAKLLKGLESPLWFNPGFYCPMEISDARDPPSHSGKDAFTVLIGPYSRGGIAGIGMLIYAEGYKRQDSFGLLLASGDRSVNSAGRNCPMCSQG
jgi:hypothetical protein